MCLKKNSQKIASIGAINYNNKPTWTLKKGINYANQRAKLAWLYKERHRKDIMKKNSNGYFADKILW